MELKMMYPEIIPYSLLAAGILLLVWRRRKKYKKGILVANTKYVKKSGYYKFLFIKYHFYNILIKALCILSIFTAAYLTARIYKTDEHNEEYFNRDIMLCLDVSGSVWNLDADMLKTFVDVVSNMKDQRFGLTLFDSSPVTVIPLTNDYDYAISVLQELSYMFDQVNGFRSSGGASTYYKGFTAIQEYQYYYKNLLAGTRVVSGSSMIGDGLAYCSSTFKKDKDRTKVVILATDNLSGKGVFTLDEAADYAKENDIKVYSIGTPTIENKPGARQGLIDASNKTNGVYYDYSRFSTDEISKKIDELDKTAIVKKSYVTNQDLPKIIFPFLLYLIPILFALDWRVRI